MADSTIWVLALPVAVSLLLILIAHFVIEESRRGLQSVEVANNG